MAVTVLNNKLYLMGGHTGSESKNDVYSSTNGADWSLVTSSAPWIPRSSHVALTFQNKYDNILTSIKIHLTVINICTGYFWLVATIPAPLTCGLVQMA